MEKGRDDELSLSRIPVFVFPSSVVFNANDRDHLKQILTIYNPYEFPVRFKVLSTAPANYTVIDPEGSINSKNSVDLIVKLTSSVPCQSSTHFEDKFRVQIYNYTTRSQLGRKDVPSLIHFGSPNSSNIFGNYSPGSTNSLDMPLSESFQQCPSIGMMGTAATASGRKNDPMGAGVFYNHGSMNGAPPGGHNPNYVAVLTALVCIIGLLLPTNINENTTNNNNKDTSIPSYLHLTINQKLLIAYTLGLMTVLILYGDRHKP